MTTHGMMSANTSPLEVLSNAAALIEKSTICDELQTKLSNCIKEFPTKTENHLKRKGRRELAHSSSFKMKARSSSPIRDESMLYERGEHSLSPNFSPGPHTASTPPQHLLTGGREPLPMAAGDPTSNAHSSYTTYAGVGGAPQRTSLVAVDRPDGLLSAYRGSPYHHIDGAKHSSSLIIRRNSDAMSQNSTTQSSSAGSPPIGGHSADDEDDDQPLDFSSKTMHRNSDNNNTRELEPMQVSRGGGGGGSPPTASGHTLSQLFAQQMMRPSVITCGSSLMKAQQTPPHPSAAPPPPPPPSYAESVSTARYQTTYGAAADDEENGVQRRHNSGDNVRQREQQHSRRQVVTTSCEGVSDPVIEEHFRRSLGKEYQQLFASSATGADGSGGAADSANNNSITYSVDDHFAKALGDTWIRLQKTETSQQNNAQSIAS